MSWVDGADGEIETFTGRFYNFLDPNPEDVSLEDIAHHLSEMTRFVGAVKTSQSVADHSILVCETVREWGYEHLAPAALLHDGHEAYLNDVAKPMKVLFGPTLIKLERIADESISKRFGFDAELFHHEAVKRADILALRHEARKLLKSGGPPGELEPLPGALQVTHREPREVEAAFLELAEELGVQEVGS